MRRLSGARPASRTRLVLTVVVAAGAVVAATTGMATTANPSTVVVRAKFVDASPLLVGNDVKLHGVRVGSIAGMGVDPDGHADVAMELDPAALPLHTDASAYVRPVSLLGERYLELDRGTESAPELPPGAPITVEHTGQNTDLDQVLNTVDDPTGESLAALVTVLGEGMQGNSRNVADTIAALAPAMRNTSALADTLNRQNDVLNRLVDRVEPVATALATDRGRTLDGLIDSAQRLLHTTATDQQALRSTLDELPATLQTARGTLAQLTGTADATVPTLRSLRPVTENLTQIADELQQFAGTADPALAAANPVLAKAQSLLEQARPVVAVLRASGADTRTVASALKPIAGELTANLTNVFDFIKNWALATNGADGLSHYFRAMIVVTPETVSGAVPGLGSNLGVGGSPAPLTQQPGGQPVSPGAPQQPGGGPAGSTPVLSTAGNPGGLLGGTPSSMPAPLLTPNATPDGGVTGLTAQQESGALGFLLGGL